jgi:hypothetical protein
MRTSGFAAVAAVVVLGSASVLSAQTAEKGKAPMPMQPGPEMAKLKEMVGTWKCRGKQLASPMGPEHPTEATVKVEEALNGMWIVGHYSEKKTAQNPMPMSGDDYWTYDAAEKMFDRVAMDSMGGFSTGNSKGWENRTLVWTMEGMMGGQKTKFRETFVQKSPRELELSGEFSAPDGKWTKAYEATCTK